MILLIEKEDKNPFQKGKVEPGARTDIYSAIEKLKTSPSISSLVQTDDEFAVTYVKYPNGLTKYRNIVEPRRTSPPVVYWIYGETGTGKTRSSVEWCQRRGYDYWISMGSLQWFDGYDGERVAILDDFRTGHCKFSFLLRILDRYRISVPYKGGFRNWSPEYIFVTAPMPPREMFDLKKEGDILQLERRITHLVPSPLTVEQLESITDPNINRSASPVVSDKEVSVLPGNDGGSRPLIILDSSGEDSSDDSDDSSGEDQEDTDELSYEEQKNLKRPRLERQNAFIDLTEEEDPPKKRLKTFKVEDEEADAVMALTAWDQYEKNT